MTITFVVLLIVKKIFRRRLLFFYIYRILLKNTFFLHHYFFSCCMIQNCLSAAFLFLTKLRWTANQLSLLKKVFPSVNLWKYANEILPFKKIFWNNIFEIWFVTLSYVCVSSFIFVVCRERCGKKRKTIFVPLHGRPSIIKLK